ncbi:MAG: PD-(D/E)XK nuclease family protein, partial [Bacteroidaceae bacterium]|nr:PD-(D/E)XK nuclease family protein [Bacteroidaceae bacterium]
IVDTADPVIWTDCYNYVSPTLPTEFLNAHERQALTQTGCRLWDEDVFNLASMHVAMRPLLMAQKRLVLVTAGQAKSENTTKHPLIIRLEEAYGDALKALTHYPNNNEAETAEVAIVANEHNGERVEFSNTQFVTMRDHESYSSLNNLIQYPLDYFMEKVLRFHDRSSYEMDRVDRVKGNVAHRVIEKLFTGNTDDIQARIQKNYDAVLHDAIEACGAILLLRENLIELKSFQLQLRENIDVLLDIIRKNNLEVVATEHELTFNVGLLDGETNDTPVNGFVDMILKRADGDMVVFDFKWTSNKDKYKKQLEENASIQLALYEELVRHATDKPVAATAYFVMPYHKLYTTSSQLASMQHVERVEPSNDDELLQKTINSYRYRRHELLEGIVGTEEGMKMDEITYCMNTDAEALVPLKEYKGIHSDNPYSNFKCFKGKLK